MQKKYEFKGQYTTLNEIDNIDVFFDVVNVLMKGFEFEENEKPDGGKDLDFSINGKSRVFTVVGDNKPLVFFKMTRCEKIMCETLFDKAKAMKSYDISEDEWAAIITYDPNLKIMEPMKRVYKYEMKITLSDGVSDEYLETGLWLLKNIQ